METTLPLLFSTKYEILIGLSYNEPITNNTVLTDVKEHTEEIKTQHGLFQGVPFPLPLNMDCLYGPVIITVAVISLTIRYR